MTRRACTGKKHVVHASLEALFVSYRQSGRPEPLGEVFDRSSPQLLAVALHLCAHPADAEDALQATFVAAIDGAASWDAKKPLLPWLLGILTNQCRRIGERRARRREQALPEKPLLLDDGTPLAASERRDLVAKLREHIDRLPADQRQVLLLQLEHGLAPAEVAEVLAVPPGTVRMRLHRGLQTLRGVLPASLVALLMAALPSRGVAAVRAAVVGHAAVGAVLLGGSILMKKLLVVAAVLVLLGLGTAVLAPVWPAWPDAAKSPAVLVQVPRDLPSDANGRSDVGEPERTAVPLPAAIVPTVPSPGTGSLIVRTQLDDGTPIPNQPFRYCPEEGDMGDPIAHTGITDAAGETRIDALAPGPWRVESLRGGAKAATVIAGQIAEVNWVLPAKHDRKYTLRGLVVHADGRPAAGATLLLGGLVLGAVPFGVTDDGGRFAVELRIYLGVGARLAGHAASPIMYCYPRDTITLVLGGPEAIVHGTVVDGEGRAVAGATVEIGPRGSWTPKVSEDLEMPPTPQVAITDGAGRCTFRELVEAPLRVRVRAPGFAQHEESLDAVAGTTKELRWELAVGEALCGLVTDDQGQPVKAVVQLDGGCFEQSRWCGEDGRFHFPYAHRGVQRIAASAASGFMPRTVEVASVRAGEPIVLQRRVVYTLRLVDERRQPLVNWHVCQMPRWTHALRTDDNGAVDVVPRVREPQEVFVSPPDALEATMALPWPNGTVPGVPCDVIVPDSLAPTATVHGVAVAADGSTLSDAAIVLIELRSPAGRKLAESKVTAGAFQFTNVPVGDWQLRIRHRDRGDAYDPGIPVLAVARGEVRDLGTVRTAANGTLRLDVRTADGGAPHGLRVLLFDRDGDTTSVPTDGKAHALPCATYRWQVFAEAGTWRTGEVEVRAGERTDLEIVLPPGTAHSLRITSPAWVGHEGRRVEYCIRAADGTLAYHNRDGRLWSDGIELHPTLSTGTWHVEAALDDGRRFTGSFEVTSLTAPRAPTEVVLALVP